MSISMKNLKLTPKRMAVISITAAIYAALTLLLPVPAYGEIQCRLSEVLNLLAFVNPIFAPGIIIGCFIANLFSPMPLDIIVGTAATAISVLFIARFSKNLFIASLYPTIFNGIIIAALIMFASLPSSEWSILLFLGICASISIGEFIAVTVIGFPVFRQIMKNEKLMKLLTDI